MSKKKALLPLIIVVVAALVAAGIFASRKTVERQESAVPPPLVRVQRIELQDAPLVVRGNGSAQPAIDTTLVAQVSGRIARVGPKFANGASLSRGDLLLEIERRDYELNVAQAEASVAQAKVRLDRERAEAELAIKEWQALGLGEASPLATREPQLAEAEASLAAAEAALEMAQLSLNRTAIRAPFAGQLRHKRVDLGQFVTPGSPVADVFSTRYAEVALPVPQHELGFLDIDWQSSAAEGPEVLLRGTVAGAEHSWAGRVVRVSQEIDPQTRMTTLYVRIDDRLSTSERPVPLPMGTFLDVAVAGRVAENVAILPRAALREGNRVLVVDDEGRLRFRFVDLMRFQDEEALIAAGLEPGETVCVSALEAPVEGMQVRTEPTADTADAETRL